MCLIKRYPIRKALFLSGIRGCEISASAPPVKNKDLRMAGGPNLGLKPNQSLELNRFNFPLHFSLFL